MFNVLVAAFALFVQLSLSASNSLAKQPTCVIAEMAPSSFVNDTVNVVGGTFSLKMHHLYVPGHVPLDLIQFYNSQSNYTPWLGNGMSLNYCFSMQGQESANKRHDKEDKYAAMLAESPGGSIIRCIAKARPHGRADYYLDPAVIHQGLTNCGSGQISARTNMKNIRVKETVYRNQYADWTCYLPDGTVREYHRAYSKEDRMNIRSEQRLNNTRLEFEYYRQSSCDGVIKKITAKANHEQNWLKFSCRSGHNRDWVESSNGKKATFSYFKRDNDYYINEIETTDNPKIRFDYTHAGDFYCIDRVSWPEGRFLEIEYDHKGRVKAQKAPVGKDGSKHTIYSFSYHDDHTRVYDAHNQKKTYTHKHGRVTSIDEDFNHHFYRAKAYYWGEKEGLSWGAQPKSDEGNLLGLALLNSERCGKLLRCYKYDDYGNVEKETIYGNLSGSYPWPFWIDSDGSPKDDNAERYHKYYKYDNNHLLVRESEDHGPSIEYRYKSGTDLVWSKLVHDGKKIIQREFYHYDNDGIVTEKIVDDGATENKSCLAGVTQRYITHIQPVRFKEGYGQGLPQEVWENYLDITTGKLTLLKHTHYNYNKAGQVTEEALFDAHDSYRYSTWYDYDSHGGLKRVTDPIGRTIAYDYDSNNNKTYEKQEGSDFHTIYEYDKANRCISATQYHYDGTNIRTSYEYDLMGNKVASTDRYGQTTYYDYDDCNRVQKITLPTTEDGRKYSISKEYDLFDNVTREVNQNGDATTYEYTIRNSPSCITYADATLERYEYNLNGTLAHKWGRSDVMTSYSYDILGRVTATVICDATGNRLSSTSNRYSTFHLLSTTDPMGHTTYYRYDGAGRKIEEWQEAPGNYSKTTYAYDTLGRLSSTKAYFGQQINEYIATYIEYDNLDHIVLDKRIDMTGACISWNYYEYDAQGMCTLKRSGNSHDDAEVRSRFNSQRELVAAIDEYGSITTIQTDHSFINQQNKNCPRRITTDALGNVAVEYFDLLGRCISILKKNSQGVLLAATDMSYNGTGKKIKQVDRVVIDGKIDRDYIVTWEYDALDRVTHLCEQPDTEDQKITAYQYDASGRVTRITKPDGVHLEHSYDALGRLILLTSSDGTVHYTYSYDLNNNPIEVRDELSGLVTKRSYDVWNRITKDGIEDLYSIEYTYDALGRPITLTAPDRSSVRYDYLHAHLHTVARYSAADKPLYEHRYLRYDMRDHVLQSALIKNLGMADFVWDKKGRSTQITTVFFTQTIPPDGFDAVGNVKQYSFKDSSGAASFNASYDDLYQLCEERSTSNHTYKHDSINNRLLKDSANHSIDPLNKVMSDSSSTFTYDKNGNLIEIKNDAGTTTLAYDALDRLISVTKGSHVTRYAYDSFHRRISRQADVGKVEYFLYQGLREIGTLQEGKIREFRVLGIGKGAELGATVAIELEDKLFAPIHDFRGNIVCLVNASTGQVDACYRYTAFGECTVCCPTAVNNPWRFAGKRFDPETDFVYFSRRYYAPTMGRWITADPLGFADGPNMYAYVHNNPLTLFDLFGLMAEEKGAAAWSLGLDDHPSETVPSKPQKNLPFLKTESYPREQPRWISVGEKDIPGTNLWGINGVWNKPEDAIANFQYISSLAGGVKVQGLYNATHGKVQDVLVAGLHAKLWMYTNTVKMLADAYKNFHDTVAIDEKILQLCHSQGAAIVRNALALCPKEVQQRVIVVSIAPAAIIPGFGCFNADNYISQGDPIPLLGDSQGIVVHSNNVHILSPHSNANRFFDHEFQSETYRNSIQDHITDYILNYRKDGK